MTSTKCIVASSASIAGIAGEYEEKLEAFNNIVLLIDVSRDLERTLATYDEKKRGLTHEAPLFPRVLKAFVTRTIIDTFDHR